MEAPFDVEKAHRWFAVECNNATWDFLEKTERTPAEDRMLVHLAHGSAFHWSEVGDGANEARSACMVANAHAALGDGHAALRHADHCVELTEAHSGRLEDWDLAFAWDALARATAALGDPEQARKLKARAGDLGEKIAGAGDREVFQNWHRAGEWHAVE